jgi:hypothetical protein
MGCAETERETLMKEKFSSYSEPIKQAITDGRVVKGMNQEQVYLAIGTTPCRDKRRMQGVMHETWMYNVESTGSRPVPAKDCARANYHVMFEEGRVTEAETR